MVTALPTEKQLCRVLLCYQKSKPFCCLHCLEDACLPFKSIDFTYIDIFCNPYVIAEVVLQLKNSVGQSFTGS